MIDMMSAPRQVASPTLRVSIGFSPQPDAVWAVVQAAATARVRFGAGRPQLALVITTTAPTGDLVAAVRTEIGPVSVAGGAASALLTEHGVERTGALVVCLGNADGATSGAVLASGADLSQAGQAAARVMLAGWPFRIHYPRGIGIAFGRQGMPASQFLDSWRRLMGPKMRTACAIQSGPAVLTGTEGKSPLASVACLEGAYATGLGYADAVAADGSEVPDAQALIHGSIDATRTALKRLDGTRARLVLVMGTEARQRALGDRGPEEWAAIRSEAGEATPCFGWLSERVAAYGRGVRPTDAEGGVVVIAIGDICRASSPTE
jgi:hypothetical protein